MFRYAVFGQPIAHSLSPRIHALFAEQVGITIDYRAIEASPADFPARLEAFARDGGRGANVTLPLKTDALTLCARLSARARRAGGVNTLLRDGDAWFGDSTDGVGLLRDLDQRQGFDVQGKRVLLLGAGGAARAVAFALVDAGAAELIVANRTRERADVLAEALATTTRVAVRDWRALADAGQVDLLVNATATGHAGRSAELPSLPIGARTFCYDISYGAAARAFLDQARGAGAVCVSDGLGMLIEQAAESFALWHERHPDTAPIFDMLSR